MTMLSLRSFSVGALACCISACGSLLDVSDPTLVQDSNIASTAGANAQRISVVTAFNVAVGNVFRDVAIFSDERMYDAPAAFENVYLHLDTHDAVKYQTDNSPNRDPQLEPLTSILAAAGVALPGVLAHADASVRGDYVTQIYAFRGYAMVQMAENLCPGFPINDIRNGLAYYSEPFSVDGALAAAVATLDTALANGTDSTRFLNFARILKGRALVDLGQYDLAKIAVATVPTDFVYQTDPGGAGYALQSTGFPSIPQAVGNLDGGTGLPFASARDPRVVSVFKRMRYHRTADTVSDSLRDQQKYVGTVAVTVASGIEARLIEAEAALHANDPATWLAKLNELRSTAISPAMSSLVDPGPATRIDTLFKERAFWMYLTGHRLGDMRRLVRQYARADTTVFPKGTHPIGVVYGTAKSIPFVFANASLYNPHITAGCASEP